MTAVRWVLWLGSCVCLALTFFVLEGRAAPGR